MPKARGNLPWVLSTALLALSALGGACSVDNTEPDPRCERDPGLVQLTDNPLSDDERVLSWERYEELTPDCIQVFFAPASEDQAYTYRYEVHESDTEVVVTILAGALPDAPASWRATSQEESLIVRLGRPLGSRTVTAGQ